MIVKIRKDDASLQLQEGSIFYFLDQILRISETQRHLTYEQRSHWFFWSQAGVPVILINKSPWGYYLAGYPMALIIQCVCISFHCQYKFCLKELKTWRQCAPQGQYSLVTPPDTLLKITVPSPTQSQLDLISPYPQEIIPFTIIFLH